MFAIVFYYEHKIRRIKRMNKVHFYVTCEVNNRGEILRNLWFVNLFIQKINDLSQIKLNGVIFSILGRLQNINYVILILMI